MASEPLVAETRTLSIDTQGGPLGTVSRVATIRKSRGIWPRMRDFASYALVYLVEGRGEYRNASGAACEVVPGRLLLVLPGHRHSYGPLPGATWSEIYVCFQGPAFDAWRAAGLLREDRTWFDLAPLRYWFGKLAAIAELPVGSPLDAVTRVVRLEALLAEILAEETRQGQSNEDLEFLANAKRLLVDGIGTAPDYPAIARQAGCSYESFRKRFARLAGTSPHQFRLRATIERAIDALVRGRPTNAELAERLGFCSEFHFSKQFKKITGLSPRDYRRQLPGMESSRHAS